MKGQTHTLLFTLARALRAVERSTGSDFDPDQLVGIFDKWRQRSEPHLRRTREEYLEEFFQALDCVKVPIGDDPVAFALDKARTGDTPPEAARFETPDFRLLVGVCRELQRLSGSSPFYLGCRKVQTIFNHDTHTTGNYWLNLLVRYKLLEIVEPGSQKTGKATRYLYRGQV